MKATANVFAASTVWKEWILLILRKQFQYKQNLLCQEQLTGVYMYAKQCL